MQLELDELRFKKLIALESATGAMTHSEAIRRLIDFAEYLRKCVETNKHIEPEVVRALFFTNLEEDNSV